MHSDGLHGQLADSHLFLYKNNGSSYHQVDVWSPNFICEFRFRVPVVNFGEERVE